MSAKISLYFHLADFAVKLETDDREVLRDIKRLCPAKVQHQPGPGRKILVCKIHDDYAKYDDLLNSIDFNGADFSVSADVRASYGFEGAIIWIKITNTAIIRLDSDHPHHAEVFRAPPLPVPGAGGIERHALPEAFFYPLLVEWVRHFGACFVHCGAVRYMGRTIFLAGMPGSGKSTHMIRMLLKGCEFLADDLALLVRKRGRICMMPFREVADVRKDALLKFPELGFLADAAVRDADKYSVDINEYFAQNAAAASPPGLILRLYPDQEPWVRPTGPGQRLAGLDYMAWYAGRPDLNRVHFDLLWEWLTQSEQWDMSQGYISQNLDQALADIKRLFAAMDRNQAGA